MVLYQGFLKLLLTDFDFASLIYFFIERYIYYLFNNEFIIQTEEKMSSNKPNKNHQIKCGYLLKCPQKALNPFKVSYIYTFFLSIFCKLKSNVLICLFVLLNFTNLIIVN